jgi:hypothetical protein
MNTERLYGWSDSEQLSDDADEVVSQYIEDTKDTELFDQWADRQKWPLRVSVFRRMDPARNADMLAAFVLELLLERLDEEYSDPDGSYTEPNDAMKAAADVFVSAVLGQYKAWACEPTNEVVEYTREMVQKLWEKEAKE